MADAEPRAGELTTANYGWTKPNVGDSDDAWGGMLNADLDGIDSTVKAVSNAIPLASSTTPAMDGTATIGVGTTFARADHIHPSDTSRYAATNPSGYQTAAQVTAAVPVASSTTPAANGTAAVGTGTTWARADHVHPSDTARVAKSGDTMTGLLVLSADPTAALGAATKQYVDAKPLNDNRIINGNFAINQRTQVSGTALVAAAYGHDRWKAGASGCTYTFTAALPDTTVTITAGTLTQVIEAGMIEGGVYTLSWTGTAQARVYQGTPTGSYAASPITTASLTAGTNTIVEFNAGTLVRAKFENGSVATPFNRQSLAKGVADCQRYYQKISALAFGGYNTTGNSVYAGYALPVQLRAVVAPIFSGISYTNASGLAASSYDITSVSVAATVTATGSALIVFNVSLSAEL